MRNLIFGLIIFIISVFPTTTIAEDNHLPVQRYIESDYLEFQRELTVGFITGSPPFQFIENNEYLGFNIDSLRNIAEIQGLKIKFKPINLKEGIRSLENGTIDILLGVHFTHELSQKISFTDAFVTSSLSVVIPKDSDFRDLSSLQNKTVSLQTDTLEYEFIKNIHNLDMHITFKQDSAFKLIMKDRSDAFIGDFLTASYLIDHYDVENEFEFLESHLIPIEYSFAVNKEKTLLLQVLNEGIRKYKISEEYSKNYNKWFGDLNTPLGEKLKKIINILLIILVGAFLLILLAFRWNRQLQRKVDEKTKHLRLMNESLKEQIKIARDSNEFNKQILESSQRGIITFNLEQIVLSMNSSACRLLKLKENYVGKHLQEIPFVNEILNEKIFDIVEKEEKFFGQEYKLSNTLNEEQYIRYDLLPFYDAEQNIIGVLFLFEDFTEEKLLERQLVDQEKSRALIQLVAGIAHEIRTPLTSIKTFVEMIPYKMNNKRFQREIVTHVPKEIERLNILVEELINYAKPKSQNKKWINLSEILSGTLLLFKQQIEQFGFHLNTIITNEIFIFADENQIKQTLINLILNAIEAMKDKNQKGLSLSVKLFSNNEKIILEIEDEGIGIKENIIDRVIEPFYSTKPKGTGLGLSLSNQFIKENNGVLNIFSDDGKGTKITIHFPKQDYDLSVKEDIS